jgi:hypothetical protein
LLLTVFASGRLIRTERLASCDLVLEGKFIPEGREEAERLTIIFSIFAQKILYSIAPSLSQLPEV